MFIFKEMHIQDVSDVKSQTFLKSSIRICRYNEHFG